MARIKSRVMSVFLLKKEYTAENALRSQEDMPRQTKLAEPEVEWLPEGFRLFLADYSRRPPWWRDFLGIKRPLDLESKGAILFLSVKDRVFVITFGIVAHYLKPESYEYDFGLIASLNALDPQRLKSTDVLNPEDAKRQHIQSARDNALYSFGIDFYEMVIKNLTGAVQKKYEHLFSTVTGGSNIRITTKVQLDEILDVCEELLDLYRSTDYKSTFPDLRNVCPVLDPITKQWLDNKLVMALKKRDPSVILSIPDNVDYQAISGIRLYGPKRFSLIQIESLWEAYRNRLADLSIERLRQGHVDLYNENGDSVGKSYSTYRCLIWSCEHKGKNYHFNEGAWYEVDNDFIAKLKVYLDSRFVETWLPDNFERCEGEYNKKAAESMPHTICLDMENLAPKKQTPVEPCDLCMVRDGVLSLIHVKVGVNSQRLGHLFNQGFASAKLLKDAPETVARLENLLAGKFNAAEFQMAKTALETGKVKIIYAIISKKDAERKSDALPLFSRITLRRNIRNLIGMNYTVEVQIVKDRKMESVPVSSDEGE